MAVAAGALLACTSGPARAARPLTTDDTGIVAPHACQIESWVEHDRRHDVVNADPACALSDSVELDLGAAHDDPGDRTGGTTGYSLGVKIAPSWAVRDVHAGTLSFAWKAEVDWQRDPGTSPYLSAYSTTAVAALAIGPAVNLSSNVVITRDARTGTVRVGALAAAAWQPGERALGYAEVIRPPGAATRLGLGLRWWVVPGKLGVDLGAARRNDGAGGTAYNLGFGWYGIGAP